MVASFPPDKAGIKTWSVCLGLPFFRCTIETTFQHEKAWYWCKLMKTHYIFVFYFLFFFIFNFDILDTYLIRRELKELKIKYVVNNDPFQYIESYTLYVQCVPKKSVHMIRSWWNKWKKSEIYVFFFLMHDFVRVIILRFFFAKSAFSIQLRLYFIS